MSQFVFNPLSGQFDIVNNQAVEIQYDNGASGLTATNVQTAIDEIEAQILALPDPITYKGTWNAATNTPTLANTDVGVTGFLYQVNAAGVVNFGAGNISFAVGDKVVNDGTAWQKWDMTDAVASVNSQTGIVVLNTGDISEGAGNLYFTNARAQAAITGGASTIVTANLTADRALVSDVSGKVAVSTVTATELGYSSGVTSAIQTQLNAKEPTITILPIAKGGTNSGTALSNNRIMRSSGGAIVEAAAITPSRALASDVNGIPVASTVTATEQAFVSGVTSAIQTQLDGKQLRSVLTTKGDLYVATASDTTTRMPAGIDGTFLKADSSVANGVVYSSANGVEAYRSVTTTDTSTAADNTLALSSASFTETLYTAIGNTGKILTLMHQGTSLTQVYTLNTTGGQTIGGIASGSYALYTNGETLRLQSNGTNWVILGHMAQTDWINAGALTIGGSTTAPTKATVTITDEVFWKRSGDTAFVRMYYKHTAAAGSAAGSGTYLFTNPTGLTIDTAKATGDTVVYTTSPSRSSNVGSCNHRQQTTALTLGFVAVWDSTRVTMNCSFLGTGSATLSPINSTNGVITSAAVEYGLTYAVPITGWRS